MCVCIRTAFILNIYKLLCTTHTSSIYYVYLYVCCEKLGNFFSGEIGGSYSVAPVAVSASLPSSAVAAPAYATAQQFRGGGTPGAVLSGN